MFVNTIACHKRRVERIADGARSNVDSGLCFTDKMTKSIVNISDHRIYSFNDFSDGLSSIVLVAFCFGCL